MQSRPLALHSSIGRWRRIINGSTLGLQSNASTSRQAALTPAEVCLRSATIQSQPIRSRDFVSWWQRLCFSAMAACNSVHRMGSMADLRRARFRRYLDRGREKNVTDQWLDWHLETNLLQNFGLFALTLLHGWIHYGISRSSHPKI